MIGRLGLAPAAAAVMLLAPALRAGPAGPPQAGDRVDFRSIKLGLAHVGVVRTRGELVATRWLGTGFVVDRDCTVMTAKHIFEDVPAGSLVLRFLHASDPDAVRTFRAELAGKHPERDVALVRLGGERLARQLCRKEIRPFVLSEPLQRGELTGESVLVAGFPVLEGEQPRDLPILRRGIVASDELQWGELPMLLLDLTGVPGFSGSPVIRERDGRVVGVIYGPGRTARKYDFEWATPVDLPQLEAAAGVDP